MGTRAEVLAKVLDALCSVGFYCSFAGHLSERTNDLLLGHSSILSYRWRMLQLPRGLLFFRICTKHSLTQGGSRIKKECLGSIFLVKPFMLDLPTYIIRHMSIYGKYDIIFVIVLILQMPCILNFTVVFLTQVVLKDN